MTDRGMQLTSAVRAGMCSQLGTEHVLTRSPAADWEKLKIQNGVTVTVLYLLRSSGYQVKKVRITTMEVLRADVALVANTVEQMSAFLPCQSIYARSLGVGASLFVWFWHILHTDEIHLITQNEIFSSITFRYPTSKFGVWVNYRTQNQTRTESFVVLSWQQKCIPRYWE
jgi:hypothetical protein